MGETEKESVRADKRAEGKVNKKKTKQTQKKNRKSTAKRETTPTQSTKPQQDCDCA